MYRKDIMQFEMFNEIVWDLKKKLYTINIMQIRFGKRRVIL